MKSKHSGTKDFFVFSKTERNGIIVLVVIIILLILAPYFYRSFFNAIPSKNTTFYSSADSFFTALTQKPEELVKKPNNPIEHEEFFLHKNPNYFFFDPNNASIEEFVQLGLSVKQAQVIERYRSKGGRFKTPEEFSKMYVIDSSMFKKLKPWIRISFVAKSNEYTKKDSISNVKEQPIIVELNSADTLELTKIKGIGKAFARRIIAYRDLLGGYVRIDQLGEVYGMRKDLINSIASNITLDSTKIKFINLNLTTYEELKKHPYISDYQAKAIIYYRSKVGNIKNRKELLDNKLLPLDKYMSIKSYLKTN